MEQTSTADDAATNDNQTAAAVLHNALEDDLNGRFEMDYTDAEREWMHNALDDLAAGTETPDETEDFVMYADDDYVVGEDDRGTISYYVDDLPESSDLLEEEAIAKISIAHTNAAREVSGDDLLGSNTDVHVSARDNDEQDSDDETTNAQIAESRRAQDIIAEIQDVAHEEPHIDLVRALQETRNYDDNSDEIEFNANYSVPDHIQIYLLEDGDAVVRYDDPNHIETSVAFANDVADIIEDVSEEYDHVSPTGGDDE